MFDEGNEPVDIFADVDAAPAPGASPASDSLASPNAPQVAPGIDSVGGVASGPSKLVLGIVGLVVIGGIGAGVYFFIGGSDESTSVTVGDLVEGDDEMDGEAIIDDGETVEGDDKMVDDGSEKNDDDGLLDNFSADAEGDDGDATANDPILPPDEQSEAFDTDGDGLTDEEELALGTNPQAVDTDGDGLSDREEVRIYKTDPKNPDSDGDTFLDGEEVKAGYNPLGEGRLFGIPTL